MSASSVVAIRKTTLIVRNLISPTSLIFSSLFSRVHDQYRTKWRLLLDLQSKAGSTSCRPKSPATRVRIPLLSSALTLRAALSRTRLHDLRNLMLWTTWRASDRDRASRRSPTIDKRQLFIRCPQSVSHLLFFRQPQFVRRQQSTKTLQCNRCPQCNSGLRCHTLRGLMVRHRL